MTKIFIPTGHSILIKIPKVKEKKIGSLILADADDLITNKEDGSQTFAASKDKKNYQAYTGTVVALGETAYFDKPRPWCKVGDEVYFISQGARAMHDEGWYGTNDLNEHSPPSLRHVFDIDVTGVFKEVEELTKEEAK